MGNAKRERDWRVAYDRAVTELETAREQLVQAWEAARASAEPCPWTWDTEDPHNDLESMSSGMVIRITAGQLREAIEAAREQGARAERERWALVRALAEDQLRMHKVNGDAMGAWSRVASILHEANVALGKL